LKTLARQLTTNSSYSTLVHPLTDEEYLDLKKSISENALFCVTKTIDKIMTGEIEAPDLVISKQLRMDITKYRNIFPFDRTLYGKAKEKWCMEISQNVFIY
jgi:DNA polymerase elongation subunit (family B)